MKSPSNNSNIRSLIHFKMTERMNFFMQYSVPHKQPFWLLVSVKKIMSVDCLKRRTLIKLPNRLWWSCIRLQQVSIHCQPHCVVLTRLQNLGNHYHCDILSTHQAVQYSHLRNLVTLVEITHPVTIATMTRIQSPCMRYCGLP